DALLPVLRRLGGPLVRHFRGLVAPGVSQDPAAQPQRLGVGLEGERPVKGEQGAVWVAQSVRRVAQLVPHEPEAGIKLDRLLQRRRRALRGRDTGREPSHARSARPGTTRMTRSSAWREYSPLAVNG